MELTRLLILCSLLPSTFAFAQQERAKKPEKANKPIVVRTVKAELMPYEETYMTLAKAAAEKRISVHSKVIGKLASLGPKEGERVHEKDLLFRVDRNDPGETFLSVPVLSPMSGWVERWQEKTIGTRITPDMPVLYLVDDRTLQIDVELPEAKWLKVTKSTEVLVNWHKEEKKATITHLARGAMDNGLSYLVTVQVPNDDLHWKPESLVEVKFFLERSKKIILSAKSLFVSQKEAIVYGLIDGKAKAFPVVFSFYNNDQIVIEKGIEPGLSVIVDGTHLVADDMPVTDVSDMPK